MKSDLSIAFIGLGNMGKPMAHNIIKSGFKLKVFDINKTSVNDLVTLGAIAAKDYLEISKSDIIITMLPKGEHVIECIHRLLEADDKQQNTDNKKQRIFIDCSTIDVATTREVAKKLARKNILFGDAPVSGGTKAAQNASLTFMVGGSKEFFTKVEKVLALMGKNIFHAGEVGCGQGAKIANNMLLAINMIGTCEAFSLANKLGLDTEVFYNISSNASGQNWAMTSYCPVAGPLPHTPANHNYEAGFAVAMMLKDLCLAEGEIKKTKQNAPLGLMAKEIYEKLNLQMSKKDFSIVMKYISKD